MSNQFSNRPHIPEPSNSTQPETPSDDKKPQEAARTRRRNRLITSCLECRRRKLKCDKQQPCINCTKFSRSCVFIQVNQHAQAKLAEVKEKMGILERALEEEVAAKNAAKRTVRSPSYEAPVLPGQEPGYSDQEEEEDARDMGQNNLLAQDVMYYDDDDDDNDDNDDLADLGIAMGKMRITERIGGFFRPRFAEEWAQLASAMNVRTEDDDPDLFPGGSLQTWLSPGNEYIAPSSGFLFGASTENASPFSHLPSKTLVDKLLDHYWLYVHTIARTVHRPSFERNYETFWDKVSMQIEPRPSFQALLFAAMLCSAMSMSEEKVLVEFGVNKQSLVATFKQGTESALARANFLRTTKLETLQAFVTYLIPLCRAELSRAHSALTGTCIRLAECMGLHRDPSTYISNPIEIQIRRLIWFQIGFLDIRTSEAIGPRPQIRRDEYDTQFPLNVEDEDLERAAKRGEQITKDSKQFTAMTITRIRIECYEMVRFLLGERPKLEHRNADGSRKVTITSILSRIQAFAAGIEKTYLPMMNKNNPLHVCAMEIYGILSCRPYLGLLHPFASHENRTMPERLRQIMLSACIRMIEHTMNLETHPLLAPYGWITGALHQYQVALLLLSEMYVKPPAPDFLKRAWRCLDYAFELPGELSPDVKGRMVLKEIVARTSAYAAMRKIRAPVGMGRPGPRKNEKEGYAKFEEGGERDGRGAGTGAVLQHFDNYPTQQDSYTQPPQQQQPPSHPSLHPYNPGAIPRNGPVGAIPLTDWGSSVEINVDAGPATGTGVGNTFDYHTSTPPQPHPSHPATTTEPFDLSALIPAPPGLATNLMTFGDIPVIGETETGAGAETKMHRGDDAGAGGSVTGTDKGVSAKEAMLNDIDWNEWDKLFGDAEMGEGNMVIPPFTFPSFVESDFGGV